jgi:hypothetical protein
MNRYDRLMLHRHVALSVVGVALIAVLAGCRGAPPSADPDRAESVMVPAGRCEIAWWLTPVGGDVPAEAQSVAAGALDAAVVDDDTWRELYSELGSDPDLDGVSAVRLQGSAYLEVVRTQVRTALDTAGYPDTERVIEVYADLACAPN